MKNRLKKALSSVLALLMVVNALTLLATAQKPPYRETVESLTEDNLLLSMDDLTGANLKVKENSGYTYTAATFTESEGDTAASPTVNGKDVKQPAYDVTAGWQWYSYAGKTNLPLSNDSKYTITFDFHYNVNARSFNYTLTLPENMDNGQNVSANSSNYIYAAKGKKTATGNQDSYGNEISGVVTRANTDETHSMILSIDAGKIDVWVDGSQKGTLDITSEGTSYYTDNVLALGARTYFWAQTDRENMVMFSMSDIKVYGCTYSKSTVTNAEDGDLLLYLDDFDLTDGTTFESELDLTVTEQDLDADTKTRAEVDGEKIVCKLDKNEWYYAGVETSLPLDANSKYTIEFYVKELLPHSVGLGWSNPSDSGRYRQGFQMLDKGDTGIQGIGETDNGWGSGKLKDKNGTLTDIWVGYNVNQRHADKDGYVRYTISISGSTASLYIGGYLIVENAEFKQGLGSNLSLFCMNYTNETKDKNAAFQVGDALCIKDIRVWQGSSVRQNIVTAVLPDGSSQELTYTDGMITSFPTVTDVAENETIIWTYSKNGSNVVALAPLEVTCDMVLTAKKVKITDNTLAGMQYTAVTDNKQSVRFISTIHSLNGSAVGFEITAKYMKNGALTEQKWDKSSTYVYTSIKATSKSGTVKDITANELGGTYLFAISVDEVPANIGQIDFYVRSYVIANGEKVYNSTQASIWTMNNGVYDSAATPLQSSGS